MKTNIKNLYKSFLVAIVLSALLFTPSCSKFLDQAPNSGESKDYVFEDYTRAIRYMDLLYYYMFPTSTTGKLGGNGFLESATDMSEYSAAYGVTNQSFNVGNWKHGAANNEIARWYNAYQQIRRAYMFLENMDNFNNEPTGRKVTMKAEVHWMIAYYYFELLKRYGGVPIVDKVLTLDSDLKIPRATYEATSKFILDNIDLAEADLPVEWGTDDMGRVNQYWCKALRSRVTLHAASPLNNPSNDKTKWVAAANAARDLIDLCNQTGKHKLCEDWQHIFMGADPEEISEIIIYTKNRDNTVNFNSNLISGEQATPGDGFWGTGSNNPTQNFVDRFEVIKYDGSGNVTGVEPFDWNNDTHVENIYKNRDPRFYFTVLYNGRYWIKRNIETWFDGSAYGKDINPKNHNFSRTGYYIRKFWPQECRDSKQPGSYRISAFYLRLTEIYLNYAEAMNEAFGPDVDGLNKSTGTLTAIQAVNKLRARLVCPATDDIPDNPNHPYYYVKVEREQNPDLPVLKDGMPLIPTGLTTDQARERIHNERVIELAFEDHYFYDILRWKKGPELMGQPIYGVNVRKNGDEFTYSRAKVEERYFDTGRMYLYPIPLSEIYKLNIQQNPGW